MHLRNVCPQSNTLVHVKMSVCGCGHAFLSQCISCPSMKALHREFSTSVLYIEWNIGIYGNVTVPKIVINHNLWTTRLASGRLHSMFDYSVINKISLIIC